MLIWDKKRLMTSREYTTTRYAKVINGKTENYGYTETTLL